jgi:hypothetical protein
MERERKKLATPTAVWGLGVDEAGILTGRLRKFAMFTEIGPKSTAVSAHMLHVDNNTHRRMVF